MRRVFLTLALTSVVATATTAVAPSAARASDNGGVIAFTTAVYVGDTGHAQGDFGRGLCQPGFRVEDGYCFDWSPELRTDPNTWLLQVPDPYANLEPPTTCLASGVFDNEIALADARCSVQLTGLFTANELGVGPSCSALAASTEWWEPSGWADMVTIDGVRSDVELSWSSTLTDVSLLQGQLTYPSGHKHPVTGYAWVRPWHNASCLTSPTTRLIISAVLVTH